MMGLSGRWGSVMTKFCLPCLSALMNKKSGSSKTVTAWGDELEATKSSDFPAASGEAKTRPGRVGPSRAECSSISEVVSSSPKRSLMHECIVRFSSWRDSMHFWRASMSNFLRAREQRACRRFRSRRSAFCCSGVFFTRGARFALASALGALKPAGKPPACNPPPDSALSAAGGRPRLGRPTAGPPDSPTAAPCFICPPGYPPPPPPLWVASSGWPYALCAPLPIWRGGKTPFSPRWAPLAYRPDPGAPTTGSRK
mmetsp:Transcript_19277/g.43695  ORF Transcript_19277/g.43695 Transcript_19277/m.43695 type:complete len:255 (-) Transcript_19277:624-1388(-)